MYIHVHIVIHNYAPVQFLIYIYIGYTFILHSRGSWDNTRGQYT